MKFTTIKEIQMNKNNENDQKRRIFEMFDKRSAEEKSHRDAKFYEFVSNKMQESKESKR